MSENLDLSLVILVMLHYITLVDYNGWFWLVILVYMLYIHWLVILVAPELSKLHVGVDLTEKKKEKEKNEIYES